MQIVDSVICFQILTGQNPYIISSGFFHQNLHINLLFFKNYFNVPIIMPMWCGIIFLIRCIRVNKGTNLEIKMQKWLLPTIKGWSDKDIAANVYLHCFIDTLALLVYTVSIMAFHHIKHFYSSTKSTTIQATPSPQSSIWYHFIYSLKRSKCFVQSWKCLWPLK